MKFPPMVRFPKGPCRYVVYIQGPKRFPHNYFAVQVCWDQSSLFRIVRGIYGYLGKFEKSNGYGYICILREIFKIKWLGGIYGYLGKF